VPVIAPSTILLAALAIDVSLGIAHTATQVGVPGPDRVVELFNLGAERNLPTWWASAKLLVIGLTLGLLVPQLRAVRREWLVVAVAAAAFLFLSLDEFASIHEALGRRTRTDLLPTSGIWPFIYGAAGLAGAAWLAVAGRRLWALNHSAGAGLIGGLIGLVGAAAVLDLANNVFAPGHAVLEGFVVIEEMGELFAVSAILYGAWSLARPTALGCAGDPPSARPGAQAPGDGRLSGRV